MFELQTIPAPAQLAGLGERVELRELSSGQVLSIYAENAPGEIGYALLAGTLYADGQQVAANAEELLALPGRFTGGILLATQQCAKWYQLEAAGAEASEASEDDAANEDSTPGEA